MHPPPGWQCSNSYCCAASRGDLRRGTRSLRSPRRAGGLLQRVGESARGCRPPVWPGAWRFLASQQLRADRGCRWGITQAPRLRSGAAPGR